MRLKVEGSCHRERIRMASGNGVIILVILLLILSWYLIINSSNNIKTQEVKQTAIAGAFDKAGTAIIVLGQKADILYWDDNAIKLFGFTNEEIINKSVDMIVPHDEEHGDHIQQSIAENDPRIKIVTCEGRKKDGSVFPIAIRVYSPFQEDKVLVLADELKPDTLTNR